MKTIGYCLVIIAGMATADLIVRWGTHGLTIDALIILVSVIAGVYLLRLKTDHSHLKTKALAVKTWLKLPTDLLEEYTSKATSGNISKNNQIIQKTLHDHGVEVSMGDVNIGPTLTQYTLKPAESVKLNEITDLWADLSLALAAHPIRIEAPIPGKNLVGIEIPNKIPALVGLREILESEEFKSSKSNLTLALGRDVSGVVALTDLREILHILMSGATGSGKSVLINDMIMSLIYQNTPEDLRLILIDPKRVEFIHYNNIPHLLCPVIYDVDKSVSALRWAMTEMDRRIHILEDAHYRNIDNYNQSQPKIKLPHIVIFIDEFSDLMAQAANEVEAAVVRVAQMCKAVGIHLIIATSRPSTDVITSIIKANMINRIGLATASAIDSLTIIDTRGAEKLLGKGDILFGNEANGYKRIQVSLVTDNEIKKITDFLKNETPPGSSDQMIDLSPKDRSTLEDDFYEDAKKVVLNAGLASATLLQRRLRIGYARASKLLDMLEAKHIIGPEDGPKPRKVLINAESKEPDAEKKK